MTDKDDPHRLRHLTGCHPDLSWRVVAVLGALKNKGHVALITQGVRTVRQQQDLYAQGRYKPGKIVTDCDGVIHVSNHQPKNDGYGYAVDIAWRLEDGTITWAGPWALFGALAKSYGLNWGGYWRKPDQPHVELPSPVPTAARA